MRTVSSRQHPVVRDYRSLASEPDPAGVRLLLDGAHLVREARAAGLSFESVAVQASRLATATEEGDLARLLEHNGVDIVAVDDRVFPALSPVHTPSGLVAIVRRQSVGVSEVLNRTELFALGIVGVQDPGNVGALLRIAEAGGMSGAIVTGESASPFSWKSIRGSMGSVLRLPVARDASIEMVMAGIRQAGAKVIASVPRDGRDPDQIDWSGRVVLLLGGEGPGLDAGLVAECDERMSIPMAAPVESLNVATSAAIAIYAARRIRR